MSSTHLEIRPISLKDANNYVEENHRHHRKATGHKFSLGVWSGDTLHGVAIVGRPLSRFLDDGETLEVLRLCTDGTYNACSILYARCAKIAKDMGYKKIITYILEEEAGTSVRASGWSLEADSVGGETGRIVRGEKMNASMSRCHSSKSDRNIPSGKRKDIAKYFDGGCEMTGNTINDITEIILNCEAVQNSNESEYTKEQAKLSAYDDILAVLDITFVNTMGYLS